MFRKHSGIAVALTLAALCATTPAFAWKPTTHVYFAEIAAKDAADGSVEIPLLDGRVLTYPITGKTLDALKSRRAYYRAGVLGPDGYPDMMTGQQVIHPSGRDSKIKGGSDAWLNHIWGSFKGDARQHAFRMGFLTHAAGDMFGHTFINHFTGAPFTFSPVSNAIKHVVLEGYVDKRLPANALKGSFFDASISGLEGLIYSSMVDADRNKALRTKLLRSGAPGTAASVPSIFSSIRTNLRNKIKWYNDRIAQYDDDIEHCAIWNPTCYPRAKKNGFIAANGIQHAYRKAWIKDVDEGLRAWPGVSHRVAVALFFNSERKTDTEKADEILTWYAQRHLLSMAGAPDFVGATTLLIGKIIDAITPDFLLEPIRKLKENMLNAMLKAAIGMDKNELKKYLTRPDRYFDEVMNKGAGENVTLKRFNAKYLHIRDTAYKNPAESFDYRNVPAAYNTALMSKLIYLSNAQINDLLGKVGSSMAGKFRYQNIMLGFIDTLDGSRQWQKKLVFAQDCTAWNALFKPLPGNSGC